MKNQKGITLVALAVTIVVLLILITTFTYNINSYVENKKRADIKADLQRITEMVEHYYAENKKLPILNKYSNLDRIQDIISNNDNENYYVIDLDKIYGAEELTLTYGVSGYKKIKNRDLDEIIMDITDIFIINEQSHIVYYPAGVNSYDDVIYKLEEVVSETQSFIPNIKTDGSWNEKKKVNSPKLQGTGLTAIYWDDNGNEIELTNTSKATDWDNWYDYEHQKWANAITKDKNGNTTGYFVWIPRYAYKIKNNLGTSIAGEIEVVFVDINDKNGDTTYLETYPTVENNAMTDFVVHPAFTTNVENGGWDENIPGFWVAKYPAGYQANTITIYEDGSLSTTISNSSDTVVYSNKIYTSVNENYATNALGQTLVSGTTKMSYPVFKPLTYAYNNISIGDSYIISRDIQNATSFYGLNNVNSHMLKNSEWGACAYLTQSRYGKNGVEVNINNYYTSTASPYRVAVTGIYTDGTDVSSTDAISVVNAYNTTIGKKGSSTGNLYGVYDLNGCIWERTVGLVSNGNINLLTYGEPLLDETNIQYTIIGDTKQINANTGKSTKYVTIYPSDDLGITNIDTASAKNYSKNTLIYGDSVRETSTNGIGVTSWYGDYSYFPGYDYPFFVHGGSYWYNSGAGLSSFTRNAGFGDYQNGFRAVLVAI